MKILNIYCVLVLGLLALFVQEGYGAKSRKQFLQPTPILQEKEESINTVQKVAETTFESEQKNKGDLTATFVESKLAIARAEEVIEESFNILLSKEITLVQDLQNIKTIIEQIKIIALVQQNLEKKSEDIAQGIKKETEGYWNRFITGIKNTGSRIAGWFASYTEAEKALASLIVKNLIEIEIKISEKYALLQKEKEFSAVERAQLKARYDAIIKQIESSIYEQQLITGEAKSLVKRGLLLGAAAAGTVVGGMILKDKYIAEEDKEELTTSRILEEQEKRKAPTIKQFGEGVSEIVAPPYEYIKEGVKKTDVSKSILKGQQRKKVPTFGEMGIVARDYFSSPGEGAQDPEKTEGLTYEDLVQLRKKAGKTIEEVDKYVKEKLTKMSDYFSSPGEGAQDPQKIEGLTYEDLAQLRQKAGKTIEKVGEYAKEKLTKGPKKFGDYLKKKGILLDKEQNQSEEAKSSEEEKEIDETEQL